MREILFRGKTLDGRWVEGSYGYSTIICEDTYVATVIYSNDTNLFTADWDEVISETVGQYTGLTDKNGKKIFEGDIVKMHLMDCADIGFIRYNNECCRFQFVSNSVGYGFDDTDVMEVIGNVYDNPELLEGDK